MTIPSITSEFNILLDELPTSIEIEGKRYAINSSYRAMILIYMNIHDGMIDGTSKLSNILDIFYIEKPQCDLEKSVKALWDFYAGGDTVYDNGSEGGGRSKSKMTFCYHQDANLIYAAFIEQYGIDLHNDLNMHWWKFKTLFNALSDTTMFGKIRSIRQEEINSKTPKEYAKSLTKAKQSVALRPYLTLEQLIAHAERQNEIDKLADEYELAKKGGK